MSSDVCNNDVHADSGIITKLPISERPPVPGAVCERNSSNEGIHLGSDCYNVKGAIGAKMAAMATSVCEELRTQCEPEGSDSSLPPYTRWGESLQALLSDSDGAKLFRKFLSMERQENPLLFYYAVEGFKKDSTKITELARIIFRKFVKSDGQLSVKISSPVRTQIADCIRTTKVEMDLFDAAQAEVEGFLSETFYPMFLKSDVYVQYVNNGGISPDSTESTGSSSNVPVGYLPTLHEDSELANSSPQQRTESGNPLPLTREMLLVTSCHRSKPGKQQEGQYLRPTARPSLSPYHPSFAAYAPAASANDSELQSLSSDAISDDTMSLTDSSIDGFPIFKPQTRRRSHKEMKRHLDQNGRVMSFPEMPRMPRPSKEAKPMKPAEFAQILTDKLEMVLKDREAEERLKARLRKVEEEDLDVNQPITKDTEPLLSVSGFHEDDPNSILDEHLLRVFKDSAKHSPGGFSPRSRSRSPDHSHRAKVSQIINPPQLPQQPNIHSRNVLPYMHKNSQRQRIKEGSTHYSEYSIEPDSSHHYHLHRHYSYGKQEGVPHNRIGVDLPYYARVYSHETVGMSPYSTEVIMDSKHKKKSSKKGSDISSSSKTTDSGIFEGPPSLPSDDGEKNKRIESWIRQGEPYLMTGVAKLPGSKSYRESKRSHRTAQDGSSAGMPKKLSGYSTSRTSGGNSTQERTHTPPVPYTINKSSHLPSQPFMQDPSMPLNQPPNARTVLEEARRRIDLSCKQKGRPQEGASVSGKKERKPSSSASSTLSRQMKGTSSSITDDDQGSKGKKSGSSSSASTVSGDSTTVAYYLCNDPIPYRTTLPGKQITLRHFKTLISKRGTYRYTFKMPSEEFASGVVHEIINDDDAILPIYEGKIVGKVEKIDCAESHI